VAEPIQNSDINESDVKIAVDALDSAPFKARFIRTDCNAADPDWTVPGGQQIKDYVSDQIGEFKGQTEVVLSDYIDAAVLHKYGDEGWITIGNSHLGDVVAPSPRDLLHVYGPDRDNTRDWTRFYRYPWKDKGPNGIFYSDDASIVQQGKLWCNCYSYSGQNSYTLVGVGMLFRPTFGDAKVFIRPYVQWQTIASFTGTARVSAWASASLGIFVHSWKPGGGGELVDWDVPIPVWSQNTQNYMTSVTNSGSATVTDGLAAEIFALTQRRYGIFVYAYLETSADPPRERNDLRFTTIDIDATVPYVVVEEKPV
jgi:hypothetical protein